MQLTTVETTSVILTPKQQAAVDAVQDAIADLKIAVSPHHRNRAHISLLLAGVALNRIASKLELQLKDFDTALRERGTTDAEDDLWIANLQRLTTMLATLADAKAAA